MPARNSGIHVWLVLSRAHKALATHSCEHVASLELACQSDFAVLEALLNKGPLPVNAIGQKVLLASGSITAAVDRLEGRGLVERGIDASDRRVRVVALTKPGRRFIEAAFKDHEAAMERAVSALSDEERDTLVRLLKKVGRSAAALAAR